MPPTPTVITVPADPQLAEVTAALAARAAQVRAGGVPVAEDHLLRIAARVRAAALDLRLVGRVPTVPTKIEVAAEQIVRLHHPAPDAPSTLQIVYAGGPGATAAGFNPQTELRDMLVARGIPGEEIVRAADPPGRGRPQKLLADVAAGRVTVLLANSDGTDRVLAGRAAAVHHLNPPFTPRQLQWREAPLRDAAGARVFRYLTDGSVDAASWARLDAGRDIVAALRIGPPPGPSQAFPRLTDAASNTGPRPGGTASAPNTPRAGRCR
jgi:hypothetical protein